MNEGFNYFLMILSSMWFKTVFKWVLRIVRWTLFSVLVLGVLLVGFSVFYIEGGLPDVAVLKDVQLQIPLRVFSRDGKLIAEYGQKRRGFLEEIPKPLINGILATEDQRFLSTQGWIAFWSTGVPALT